MAPITHSGIAIRELDQIEDLRKIEWLQKLVWGLDDLETIPVSMLVSIRKSGGIIMGAFKGSVLVGFVFGLAALDEAVLKPASKPEMLTASPVPGVTRLHSHMLAVDPAYRNRGIAYSLKLAQRKRALASGHKVITWTFDPLQSANAHLNFGKLGAISATYEMNTYGEHTSSFLHANIGTDRLLVHWDITSEPAPLQAPGRSDENTSVLVRAGRDQHPVMADFDQSLKSDTILIDIPSQIAVLQKDEPELARNWRLTTRDAFMRAFAEGYVIRTFKRPRQSSRQAGSYILKRG